MSSGLERGVVESRQFSIARDPFVGLLRRLRLTRANGMARAWPLAAVAWIPLCIGGVLHLAAGERPPPILYDFSVHTRFLVGIPLVIVAERLLELRCRGAINQLYAGQFAERSALDSIIDHAERLRDSRGVELAIFAIAFLVGQAALWGVFGPTGLLHGVEQAGSLSFARLWYAVVALPLAQFLFCRWLWHWLIWTYVVVRVSRLSLATIATHPDHAAGLGFLASPISGFSGIVFALAAMMASAWGTQILAGRATLQSFVPTFIAFVLVMALIACAPLLLYGPMLYRARHREMERYNGLALDYVRGFDRKWVESRPDPEALLGAPDIQSLNDLGGAYATLESLRLVPFGPRAIVVIWVAAVIPMLPLIATTMPLDELVEHVGRALLGGIPG